MLAVPGAVVLIIGIEHTAHDGEDRPNLRPSLWASSADLRKGDAELALMAQFEVGAKPA